MAAIAWIKEELDAHSAHYRETHHPIAITAQELAERDHVSGHRVAKVVAVIVGDKPVSLVVPASRRVDLERVRDVLQAPNIRLANEDEMERFFPECEVGAAPPLRHWQNIELWMDESLRGEGDILFQGGTHRDGIQMPFEEWFALVKPRVGIFSRPLDQDSRRPTYAGEDEWI